MGPNSKYRRCHGCHGWVDELHQGYPTGAEKCPIEHDEECEGGIFEGTDIQGGVWRACPEDFVPPSQRGKEENVFNQDGLDPADQVLAESSSQSSVFPPPSSTQSVITSGTTTVTTASLGCDSKMSFSEDSALANDMAALKIARETRLAAEKKVELLKNQKLAAEKAEIRRELLAEQRRTEELNKQFTDGAGVMSSAAGSRDIDIVDNLRRRNQVETSEDVPNFYDGPNINEIRKITELRENVENHVEQIRVDVPSLAHRPTAGRPTRLGGLQTQPGTRVVSSQLAAPQHSLSQSTTLNKKATKPSAEQEFEDFLAWRQLRNGGQSDVVAACPQAQAGVSEDPLTDASDDDEQAGQHMKLVYKRDAQSGEKYREWVSVPTTSDQEPRVEYAWYTDTNTGRSYKRPVTSAGRASSGQPPVHRPAGKHPANAHQHHSSNPQDSEIITPAGRKRVHTSLCNAGRSGDDRIPGMFQFSEREGKRADKQDDRHNDRQQTITDWARNCPVTYAEKITLDSMNLPIWVWGFVSELLATRTGLATPLMEGELESKLQHLLCVLEVTMVNSEKTDFNSQGWSIAKIYAKRVQQKLDRGLDTWLDFSRFGTDPHPSEMFAAKLEVERRPAPSKKKGEFEQNKDRKVRAMCPTWNTHEVEKQCKWMADNPNADKPCNRRHDCSYCLEKKYGSFNHQRRFCTKRRAAGDE